MNYFEELNQVDATGHMEKKGKFTYLSWPFAVQALGRLHPEATWDVHEYKDADGSRMPYMATDCGVFVKVTVHVPVFDDKRVVRVVSKTQVHPVLNNQNKPIPSPNAFDINTSIMRCLVKAIALHGLALHIYGGEDLPDQPEPELMHEWVNMLNTASNHSKAAFDTTWKDIPRDQKKLYTKQMIAGWKANIESIAKEEAND